MITELDMCLLAWMEEQTDKCGIIQQLNCFVTQGAGIARRIRQKYPAMYDADIKFGGRGDRTKLGKFCVAELSPNKFGYGCYSQYNYGMEKRHTSYDAFDNGLRSIEAHARSNGLKKIGLPKFIGCKLGGGNWTIVRSIIETIFLDSPLELYICNYGN